MRDVGGLCPLVELILGQVRKLLARRRAKANGQEPPAERGRGCREYQTDQDASHFDPTSPPEPRRSAQANGEPSNGLIYARGASVLHALHREPRLLPRTRRAFGCDRETARNAATSQP